MDEVERLARVLCAWQEATEQHNRLLRGIAFTLGITTIALLFYLLVSLLRSCH